VQGLSGLEPGAGRIVARRELDAVRWESITNQLYARTMGAFVIVEHSEQDSAHVFLFPSLDGDARTPEILLLAAEDAMRACSRSCPR